MILNDRGSEPLTTPTRNSSIHPNSKFKYIKHSKNNDNSSVKMTINHITALTFLQLSTLNNH